MDSPLSRFLEGRPRLHYLEWNRDGGRTLVLLHGNAANAWWWQWVAQAMPRRYRLIALDQRGHGDSEWMRPPAYQPADYVSDLERLIERCQPHRPLLIGHSMGGLNTIAYARRHPEAIRGAAAIDVAITSTRQRDRFLRRLKILPETAYPGLETAIARFRLMPSEGEIRPEILADVARHSLERTDDGRYTLKFDRESFIGGDGLDVRLAIADVRLPLLLVRAGMSRIMTAAATRAALESNPLAQLAVIPAAHHHLPLERPDLVARAIERFAEGFF